MGRHIGRYRRERDENKALTYHHDDVTYHLKGWICTVRSVTHVQAKLLNTIPGI